MMSYEELRKSNSAHGFVVANTGAFLSCLLLLHQVVDTGAFVARWVAEFGR